MYWFQAVTIASVCLLAAYSCIALGKTFQLPVRFFIPIIGIFLLFSTGFALRLTDIQESIDIGYFLTDFSFLATYLMFASMMFLGQMKYWKIIRRTG